MPLPRHIAIIMDGNGRWARRNSLGRLLGHRNGAETVRRIVSASRDLGVEVVTLYAFSEENWGRPRHEIEALMAILREFLVSDRGFLRKHDIRLLSIGDISKLPKDIQRTLQETKDFSAEHKSMSLVLALSYGGRNEITRAVRSLAEKVKAGTLSPDAITNETISQALDTAGLPDPDLLIRTSGELRTSNFLPWQAIYAELYLTPTLWPDFSVEEFQRAVADFSGRERRFGLTSEQLQKTSQEASCNPAI